MTHAEHPNADPAFEFDEIDPGALIGTNACCQGHFEERLLKRGVTADISLEGEMLDRPYGVMTFLWLPTPDHQAPSETNVRVGVAAIDELLRAGRTIYIHCKNGHGRGPTLYAAYLLLKKSLTPEEAVAHIKSKRPGVHLENLQLAMLRKLAERRP